MIDKRKQIIEDLWNQKESFLPPPNELIQSVLNDLDQGLIRVAEKKEEGWICHEWIKKAILLFFKFSSPQIFHNGPLIEGYQASPWFDKIPLKGAGWKEDDFEKAGFRSVPGSIVRYSAHIGSRVVLMPSFVNVGAYVGEGTMIDTWVTIGSCAQIGKNCHISGGVGIGGVLEPLQAAPVIIEDGCFIGARSEIAEGVIVEEGAVISMGVFIGASTKIVNRQTGEIFYGKIPAYSVVVPGTLPPRNEKEPALSCAVIVKQVDAKTRSKTQINDLLRD